MLLVPGYITIIRQGARRRHHSLPDTPWSYRAPYTYGANCLTGRTFTVKPERMLCSTHSLQVGLPQGSTLIPILFHPAVADMVSASLCDGITPSNAMHATMFHPGNNLKRRTTQQSTLDKLSVTLEDIGVCIATQKSKLIVRWTPRTYLLKTIVVFRSEPPERTYKHRFLGLTLEAPTWGPSSRHPPPLENKTPQLRIAKALRHATEQCLHGLLSLRNMPMISLISYTALHLNISV